MQPNDSTVLLANIARQVSAKILFGHMHLALSQRRHLGTTVRSTGPSRSANARSSALT